MPKVRAAYLQELQSHLYKGEYPVPEKFSLRQTRHGPIEVRKSLEITLSWRNKKGVIKSGKWQVKPGMVLIVRYRKPTAWELAEMKKTKAERELEPPPIRIIEGRKLVAIVERNQDLFSAARKYLRHITGSLVGKLGRKKLPRGIARYQASQIWIHRLYHALENLTSTLAPDSKKSTEAQQILLQIIKALSQPRHSNIKEAQKKIAGSKGSDQIVAIAQAIGILGLYRREKLNQTKSIAKIGLSIIQIIQQIEQGLRLIYYCSIPDLLKKLKPYAIEGKQAKFSELLRLTRQIENLYHRLQRVCAFEPFYSRANSAEVKRLAKALEYAKNDDSAGLYAALIRAQAKIEALILGEKISRGEILMTRRWLKNQYVEGVVKP